MSRVTAGWDRFISLIWAVVLIGAGVWAILYHLKNAWVLDATEYVNQRVWREAPDTSWFTPLLVGIVVVAAVLGVLLVWKNLVRHRINRVHSETASTEVGDIYFHVADIAKAVAAQLESSTPRVERVSSLVAFDRGRPTVQFTVNAEAGANIPVVRGQIEQAELDVREAIGDADIATTYLIHIKPVER